MKLWVLSVLLFCLPVDLFSSIIEPVKIEFMNSKTVEGRIVDYRDGKVFFAVADKLYIINGSLIKRLTHKENEINMNRLPLFHFDRLLWSEFADHIIILDENSFEAEKSFNNIYNDGHFQQSAANKFGEYFSVGTSSLQAAYGTSSSQRLEYYDFGVVFSFRSCLDFGMAKGGKKGTDVKSTSYSINALLKPSTSNSRLGLSLNFVYNQTNESWRIHSAGAAGIILFINDPTDPKMNVIPSLGLLYMITNEGYANLFAALSLNLCYTFKSKNIIFLEISGGYFKYMAFSAAGGIGLPFTGL